MKSKTNIQLCPNCKTGADSYILDNKAPVCPYIHLYNGESCAKYKEIQVTK